MFLVFQVLARGSRGHGHEAKEQGLLSQRRQERFRRASQFSHERPTVHCEEFVGMIAFVRLRVPVLFVILSEHGHGHGHLRASTSHRLLHPAVGSCRLGSSGLTQYTTRRSEWKSGCYTTAPQEHDGRNMYTHIYHDTKGIDISPPTTWRSWPRIMFFFRNSDLDDRQPTYAVRECLTRPGDFLLGCLSLVIGQTLYPTDCPFQSRSMEAVQSPGSSPLFTLRPSPPVRDGPRRAQPNPGLTSAENIHNPS